ncbi:tigger transposable element-derived protein 4 [Plakobranchus ocellatus]|uniref:Tigger transposable element-derived protein 4 n=1 Tax=Plakobranchus ocellatus TaxID=259542 RepID=A0AAV4BPN2_9GAST|nr:tigger transposable element-derived protein 4 [Plakobranchus ocellatus]
MKRKDHYREQFYSGRVDVNKQRARLTNHDDVKAALLRWFTEVRGNNIPISGPMMKTKATSIAETLGKNNWECNEGWIARFKKRHHIVFKTLCGESSSVDDASLNQWRDNVLKKMLSKYEPFDVYNADETGLLWRLLPNKTMDFKGQECHGWRKGPKRQDNRADLCQHGWEPQTAFVGYRQVLDPTMLQRSTQTSCLLSVKLQGMDDCCHFYGMDPGV